MQFTGYLKDERRAEAQLRFGVDRLVGVDFGTAAAAHLSPGSEVSAVRDL